MKKMKEKFEEEIKKRELYLSSTKEIVEQLHQKENHL